MNASDVIVHEIGYPIKNSQIFSHLYFLSKLKFFVSIDNRPSWILSYVFREYSGFKDLYKLHGAEISFLGMNPLTSGDETMSQVVDESFRKTLFGWLDRYRRDIYGFDRVWSDICVVYSRKTLDFLDKGNFISQYAYHDRFPGMLMLLDYLKIPYTIVDERDIEKINKFRVAIFPSFLSISEHEVDVIKNYVNNGGSALFTGYPSLFDEYGERLNDFRLKELFGLSFRDVKDKVYKNSYGKGKVIYIPWTPEGNFIYSSPPWEIEITPDFDEINEVIEEFIDDTEEIDLKNSFNLEGDGVIIPIIFRRGSVYSIRLLNLSEVDSKTSIPEPVNVRLRFRIDEGFNVERVSLPPYLEDERDISFEVEDSFLTLNVSIEYLSIITLYTKK